jgi:hypothetical protein
MNSNQQPVFKKLVEFLENVLRVSTSLEGASLESLNIDYWKKERAPTEDITSGDTPLCSTTLCILGYCVEDPWFREHIFEPPYWKAVGDISPSKVQFYTPVFKEELIKQSKGFKEETYDLLVDLLAGLISKDTLKGEVVHNHIFNATADYITTMCFTGYNTDFKEKQYTLEGVDEEKVKEEMVGRIKYCLEAAQTASTLQDLHSIMLKSAASV